ncbi:DUF4259 domain-containing protein [Pseudoxanthomonas sp. UTMC 1351]|uniref:DUF4259 domain-containing protein n=1 Tax=Pseudoxanthomonas sp. UTMC 1351 TaxID=2695853 RepID=UPI0034CE51F9
MGCWAIGSFGNDSAADWLGDLRETSDLSLVRETIARVIAADGYLDSPDATDALAAIEVVAAALGRPTPEAESEPELLEWIARVKPSPDTTLISDAQQAIDRILGPESELRELWEDTEDFSDWRAEVTGLRSQLQG